VAWKLGLCNSIPGGTFSSVSHILLVGLKKRYGGFSGLPSILVELVSDEASRAPLCKRSVSERQQAGLAAAVKGLQL
jgi:hypothetical protein